MQNRRSPGPEPANLEVGQAADPLTRLLTQEPSPEPAAPSTLCRGARF